MRIVDTHAHLFLKEFDADRDEVLERARSVGVDKIYLPNIDSSTIERLKALRASHPNFCYPMMGLHPSSVKDNYLDELNVITEQLSSGNYVAVGEIGMDLYWDTKYKTQQEKAFETQVELAKQHNLPIVIHVREAFSEVFEILDRLYEKPLKGIFHCFTGTEKQAEKIYEYETFKIGIGGIVTYKNAGLDKTVEKIPLEKLVLETDAPYLPPVPHRGKRNESGFILDIATKLAQVKNISLEELASVTSANAAEIFGDSK